MGRAREPNKRTTSPAALRRQRTSVTLAAELAAIAAGLGAAEFGLFLVRAGPRQCRLQPCLDNEHPRTSRASRRLVARPIEDPSRRLHTSTRPFWWRKDRKGQAVAGILADEDNLLGLDGTGLAVPVHYGADRNGIVIFSGADVHTADPPLVDVHLRCMRLFAAFVEIFAAPAGGAVAMSPRELDCLRLTADGRTSEEIADLLGLSRHTANQHLTSATQKLNAVNRIQAVSKALRSGLIG